MLKNAGRMEHGADVMKLTRRRKEEKRLAKKKRLQQQRPTAGVTFPSQKVYVRIIPTVHPMKLHLDAIHKLKAGKLLGDAQAAKIRSSLCDRNVPVTEEVDLLAGLKDQEI